MSKSSFLNELNERESLGTIKIKEDFFLPHIKTKQVKIPCIINVEGFKNYKILFILVPFNNYDKYKNDIIKIILNLDDSCFEKNMKCSESVFKNYILKILNEN